MNTRRRPTRKRPSTSAVLALAAGLFVGCEGNADPPRSAGSPHAGSWFAESTLVEREADAPDGSHVMTEITGSGVGLLDYDGDGDLDILQIRFSTPGAEPQPASDLLLRQESDGSFRDVTESSGLRHRGYGQGLAVGDVDDDGDPDVYVTNYGPDVFLRNLGDGTFVEATVSAGLVSEGWSTSASFCDYDRDGDLDLYVARYVRFEPGALCLDAAGRTDYCGPTKFDGMPDLLYRNDGSGGFRNVSVEAGLHATDGGRGAKGLGVICADFTDDGWPDVYVANDGEPNDLWVGRGDGTFVEQGVMRGVGVNRHGHAEASMGIAPADLDGDLRMDLFVTHLSGETNTLYGGLPAGLFADRTGEAGLGRGDLSRTGFGAVALDWDHDGDLDLAVANGRVYRGPPVDGARMGPFWNDYAEPNSLYVNAGGGRFVNGASHGGRFVERVEVSRGLAAGDIDRDGDVDLVLSNQDGTLRLYRNEAPPPSHHWLRVRAMSGRRDALGARVRLVGAGGETRTALVLAGSSYLSSHEPRAHFGLGSEDRVTRIEILWPDGALESFAGGEADREIVVRQGTGDGS